jgi:plasmid maintenance system antidote protein VapI
MRLSFKLSIIAAGLKHKALAAEANRHLPVLLRLSELDVTKLVTNRKDPTPEQAAVLSRILGRSTVELFPADLSK